MPFDDTVFIKRNVDFPAFAFLTDEQLRRVTAAIERNVYKAGQTILFQGEITHNFYIVKKGAISVTTKNPLRRDEAVILASLKAGDFFGEISLLEATAATATIKASEDGTEILTVPHEVFQGILKEAPMVETSLRNFVAQRKKDKDEAIKKKLGSN